MHWRIQGANLEAPACPPSPERGISCLLPPPPKLQKNFFSFESEFGSIPKNSGLNLWSFSFGGTLGQDPAPSCPPPLKPVSGSASVKNVCLYLCHAQAG